MDAGWHCHQQWGFSVLTWEGIETQPPCVGTCTGVFLYLCLPSNTARRCSLVLFFPMTKPNR